MVNKPYYSACDRNKDAILSILKKVITPENQKLLEIGSGTGQHALYLAPHFPHLQWFLSDRLENHEGIKLWTQEVAIENIQGPLEFEIGKTSFPKMGFDLVYISNVLHIMSWKKNKTLFKMLGNRIREGGQVIIYGPFNYNNQFTSASNQEFDWAIKKNDSLSGIRNFEDIDHIFKKNSFILFNDFEMPANNRTLVYTKIKKI